MNALVQLRLFQQPVFWSQAGLLALHWSRQIGKSYVLAAWAVYRLLTRPGRLVTVLSNSRDNGAEFIRKCSEICQLLNVAFEKEDLSAGDLIENMRIECRIKVDRKWGRIKVLAANPRTARGFSGDLILDEFAFHENSEAIWDAAEPIISSNPDYLCRVASTGNGRYNKFYQMAALGVGSERTSEGFPLSQAHCPVSRVRRSDAWRMGVKIFDPATRGEITPEEARRRALDKRSYDQNYECSFNDENMALLTLELIAAAEYGAGDERGLQCCLDEQRWTRETLEFLRGCTGPLGVGIDVGRSRDLTSICVGERLGGVTHLRAMLRIADTRLPDQLRQIEPVLALPNFGRAEIDSTGIGLGLAEFAQERAGTHRVAGLHFASRERRRDAGASGNRGDTALVTELMALDLLRAFEDRRIRIPCEQALRDALRKPERVQTASGVRIAVERDEAGHADEFWSMCLMLRALAMPGGGLIDMSLVRLGAAKGRLSGFAPRRLEAPEALEIEIPDLSF
jgi:phage FluMu gp28-like protein